MDLQYQIIYEAPSAKEYAELRVEAGLSPKSLEAAEEGLKNSIFAVALRESSTLIGMGRIIGDGGCFYQIVDIAVKPAYQGRGLGKVIMSELTAYLQEHTHEGAYVSLLADVPADKLYQQFGFQYTQPRSVGMYRRY
jgi:ribosomal protein S18 acetylase RimI-like enzyme